MKDYKKYFILEASPEDVYNALTNPFAIKLWTNEEAVMRVEPESEFSIMGGAIVGRNISFITNKQLVQEWYFGEQKEQSIVTITLHEHKKGCSVQLQHTNIPEEDYEDMIIGWNDVYFGNLMEFFNGV